MDVIELQIHTEEDGIGYNIEKETFKIDDILDTHLADMISEAKLLLDEINCYINEKIQEIKERNGDNCDCNGFYIE